MRIVAHIDMDAFFAAVEEREKPWLRGLPVVVGSDPQGGGGRGVVATANYAARKYGIYSALPISKAWEASQRARSRGEPEAIFITPRFGKYTAASGEVMAIIERFADEIQTTSVDEAYADFSSAGTWSRGVARARKLKRAIKEETGLTASLGLAPNKLVSKIASDRDKPDGLTLVPRERVIEFLAPLSVSKIPGAGPKTKTILSYMGVRTIADLQKRTREELVRAAGKRGARLYEKARGVDESSLREEAERKSIGVHDTFLKDVANPREVAKRLDALTDELLNRFEKSGFASLRTLVLTVRFADFETKSRSLTTPEATSDRKIISSRALKLLLPFFEKTENPRGKAIRMIGLRLEKLARSGTL